MIRTLTRPARLVALAPVAVLVLLGGCGSDDGTSVGAAQPSTSAAPVTTAPAAPTTLAVTTTLVKCANVSFSSDPEDLATDIRPTGLSCSDAEAVVRKVGTQLTSPTGAPRVEAEGYTCVRTSLRSGDHGAPLGTFECTSGALKVSFTRALVG